ncbi:hypothetical protein T310_9181 [Rasamsonia emersonii CBS 393.64]|uniref:Uncharacterized protein n=1 Tax=Rasamsonia emersonii (strain ATCC 16479 / CBS 393.64 / IMI 116815) TaxID=1408163 RepID=A0A0F4YG68_RASE3|nr:hypothetical protein T310_9181 [Rasamsonia emersonii CBS 393.64]KKA17169.1 hypothetical protein T310_9181 [Rasamsonia emersonii CBS 393.64]
MLLAAVQRVNRQLTVLSNTSDLLAARDSLLPSCPPPSSRSSSVAGYRLRCPHCACRFASLLRVLLSRSRISVPRNPASWGPSAPSIRVFSARCLARRRSGRLVQYNPTVDAWQILTDLAGLQR